MDAIVSISPAARTAFEDEQRLHRVISINTAILIGSASGLVVAFAAFVLVNLFGG